MGAPTVEQFQNDRIVEMRVAGSPTRAIGSEIGLSHATVQRRLRHPELERRVEEGLREAERAVKAEERRARRAEYARQQRLGKKAEELRNPTQPTGPPPVPRPTVVAGSIEEQMLKRLGQDPSRGPAPTPRPMPALPDGLPEHAARSLREVLRRADQREAYERPTVLDERRSRKAQLAVARQAYFQRVFASPMEREHYRSLGPQPLFEPSSPPDAWLDERVSLLTAVDPSGKRTFRIDPSLADEYRADGFVVR